MKSNVPRPAGRGIRSSSTRRTWIEMSRRSAAFSAALSSSTRRTWIEIAVVCLRSFCNPGRPPHGGRGLKYLLYGRPHQCRASSSTRRTWIEIFLCGLPQIQQRSSSTRRTWIEIDERRDGHVKPTGRPPHGGRGLKSYAVSDNTSGGKVVLLQSTRIETTDP